MSYINNKLDYFMYEKGTMRVCTKVVCGNEVIALYTKEQAKERANRHDHLTYKHIDKLEQHTLIHQSKWGHL